MLSLRAGLALVLVCVVESLIESSIGGVADAENLVTADMAKRCYRGVMFNAGSPSVRIRFVELFVPPEFRDIREEKAQRLALVRYGEGWWRLGRLEIGNANIRSARISERRPETK